MKEEKGRAIVLTAFPYREKERILTLFGSEEGLFHLIVKLSSSRYLALSSPLTEGEFVYVRGKSDLWRFCDGTVLEDHLSLREQLDRLQLASALVEAILSSQLPGKTAPQLYQLFSLTLKKLSSLETLNHIKEWFYLKILQHEGVLSPFYCPQLFTVDEWQEITSALSLPAFSDLKKIAFSPSLQIKIYNHFSKQSGFHKKSNEE